MKITFEDVRKDKEINTYITKADQSLRALGYTEHSFPHVLKVAYTASQILTELGHPQREAELAKIAGYLHDIGNIVNRVDHAQSGAVMAFRILDNMGADPEDIATIVTAIGNHDELMKTCEVYREIYFSQFPEERAAYNNESGVIA